MQIWQRNLYAIWIAELVALAGFTVGQPFGPYFIQELGVTDLHQVEFLSGLSLSLHSLVMAFIAPVWGFVADRYGRKLMVERALFGGAVLYLAMGMVQDVESLIFLRAVSGAVTGTVPAATTLIASSTPRERCGYALGMLQVAIYMGCLLGPLLGGLVADAWGYRAAFGVTGLLLFLAGMLVLVVVRERFQRMEPQGSEKGFLAGLVLVLRSPVLLPIFALRLIATAGDRTVSPILPLFVQALLPAGARVASAAGLILGAGAAASAVGAVVFGRATDRLGHRTVLLLCASGAALSYLCMSLATDTTQVLVFQVLVGAALGGSLTSLAATLGRLAPEGRQGTVYGVDTTAHSAANFVGPLLGAAIAVGWGLRASFVVAAFIFLLSVLATAKWTADSPAAPEESRP